MAGVLAAIMAASTMAVAAPDERVITAPAVRLEARAEPLPSPTTTAAPAAAVDPTPSSLSTGESFLASGQDTAPLLPDPPTTQPPLTQVPVQTPETVGVHNSGVPGPSGQSPGVQNPANQNPGIVPFLAAGASEAVPAGVGDGGPAGLEEGRDEGREAESTTPATVWEGDILLYLPDQRPEVPPAPPKSPSECYQRAKTMPLTKAGVYDRNLVAQMTHWLFECVTGLSGFEDVSPSRVRGWNGARSWGFKSLAEQVAAEAVVVAYCESEGFSPRELGRNNPWGYGGLFQMGSTEMRRFGPAGGSKFDPVDNAYGAVTYFVFQYRNRAGWGGWSPWAVVNTSFDDEINNRVKIPVLPRFTSTDPEFVGRRGPELPEWGVDPWSFQVPAWGGCPVTGGRWRRSVPLDS